MSQDNSGKPGESGLISVIVPVYNGREYIGPCIKSITGQSYRNIEVLIVDDGSTDDSGGICRGFALRDGRIRVIRIAHNGPAGARNAGIKNSKGDFVFFADADDLLEADALALLIEGYCRTKADIIAGDFIIEDHGSGSGAARFILPEDKHLARQDIVNYARGYLRKPTGYSLFVYSWGKLFKASVIKDNNVYFNGDLRVFEDIAFNFTYLKFAGSACYVRRHIYKYFVNNTPLSAGMNIYTDPLGYKPALKSIADFLGSGSVDADAIKKEVGHARVSFTIRTMVRFFALNRHAGLMRIRKLIGRMVNDPEVRESLPYYSPSKGESKILPVLIKYRLNWLIMLVCAYKARQRHEKGSVKR